MDEEAEDPSGADQAMDDYAAGDDAAFDRLYGTLEARFLRFGLDETGSVAAAQDAFHQTMLHVIHSRARWIRGSRVLPWVYTIARRILIDRHRHLGREVPLVDPRGQDRAERPAEQAPPDEVLDARRRLHGVRAQLALLPAALREAFQLTNLEGLSVADAAESLGITRGMVKIRCFRAREALRLADPPEVRMKLPDAVKAQLLEAARASPPASDDPHTLRRTGLVLLAAAAMTGVLYLWGGPGHAVGRPAPTSAAIVAGMAALALAATWLALPPARSMLGPRTARLLAIAVGVPVVVGAWLLLWHAFYDDPNVRFGYRCFSLTLAAAPWPFVALVLASRWADSRSPRLSGGALGAASGAWAAVVVELWCPLAEPFHVAGGHVLPLVVLAALGALLGPRLFRLRLA